MPFTAKSGKFNASIKTVTIGTGDKAITLGGENALPIIMAYITVVVCISTVDNITNPVLLFLMLILRYGVINRELQTERVV